ncbi:hypothetical protein [Planomicrobium sp. Y74]|uniref:hypothetical protein n=1 Tax=Planomicrobium sp. Y74 TaxID=2478977 RepID=UPI000EF4C7A5|nr:hypothetical protein [Planomicrobium sp. Y74]RLQ90421.1 hypothetical protein D9754_11940 [Planomicrobium sp. Y74]
MKDIWEIKHSSHRIRIESTWDQKKLWVDGVLQDDQPGFTLSSRLFGKLRDENGEFQEIKVSLGLSCFYTKCRIFIGDSLIYSTEIAWEG